MGAGPSIVGHICSYMRESECSVPPPDTDTDTDTFPLSIPLYIQELMNLPLSGNLWSDDYLLSSMSCGAKRLWTESQSLFHYLIVPDFILGFVLFRIGAEKRPIVIKIIILANKINRPDTNRKLWKREGNGDLHPVDTHTNRLQRWIRDHQKSHADKRPYPPDLRKVR